MTQVKILTPYNKKFKPAASLIEVLIVLGVISTVIVSAMSLLTSAMVRVINNEIEDAANLFIVQGMEFMKSPTQVKVSAQPTTTSSYYALVKNATAGNNTYTLVRQTGGVMTDCPAGSVYAISDLQSLGYGEVRLCLQAEIKQTRLQDNKPVYEITTRIFYYVNGQLRGNYLKGYRYDAFST